MNYVMYIQNSGNLGHAEFDEYEKAYDAMKLLVARHIGVATNMLDTMMDTNGNGPLFYVHREDAYVDSNGGAGSLFDGMLDGMFDFAPDAVDEEDEIVEEDDE